MFRYLLLKLPSFTGKTDFPVSPTCNKTSILRPTSPAKREYRREPKRSDEALKTVQKRSYSFPSTRARSSNLLDSSSRYGKWDKCDLPDGQGLSSRRTEAQGSKKTSKTLKKLNSESIEIRTTYSPNNIRRLGEQLPSYKKINKPEDLGYSFESKERYELEAARPKRNRSSEAGFDVFDYVAKNGNDPVRYLQPNKLRPFGSNDNIYLPLLMATKTSDLDEIPLSISAGSFKRTGTPRKSNKEPNDIHRRSYSTLNTENRAKNTTSEEVKSSSTIVEKEINPLYLSNKLASNDIKDNNDVKETSDNHQTKSISSLLRTCSRSVEETLVRKLDKKSTADLFQSYRLSWNEPRIRIEPSPFLPTDEVCMTMSRDSSKKSKRSSTDMMPLKAPWPAYSERVKRNQQKCPSDTALIKQNLQPKMLLPQKRTISTENVTRTESKLETKQFCKKREPLTNDFAQKRSLSSENLTPIDGMPETQQLSAQVEQLINDFPQRRSISCPKISSRTTVQTSAKRCRSSSAVSNTTTTPNPAVGSNRININSRKSFGRSSNSGRCRPPFEPEPCDKEEPPTPYFLPSKVRLRPPKCMQRPPYSGCVQEEPCPPRADRCLKIIPKKLPHLKSSKCPCVEPFAPTKDVKIRRLKFKFNDPPRICPCDPCPCPPRADDSLTPKKKKLRALVPGNCKCFEPTPLVDVPLLKLKKLCEPEETCYPPKPCPKPEPCVRADDTRVECPKKLPPLEASHCPCLEPHMPSTNPQLRRLKMKFRDPERICPCEPNCPCPPRADDLLKEKARKLPKLKPGQCECFEPPPLADVPLIRLKKVCPPEVCDPQKFCPVVKCEDNPRADDKLKVKPKKLPILDVSYCKCIEPAMPDKLPKLRRLKMKFNDKPRICPCEPFCPCPPRADDSLKPKTRKLLPYVPGYCKCVEPPPLADVVLKPLKKICEPEIKCYPPKECPKEPPCVRADDGLCFPEKKLPPLKASECPCIDSPPLFDVPKLKRLELRISEPQRKCPIPEPCIRADHSLKEKIKKLPLLHPGECPCIELPPVADVKPLKRLKCEDEPTEPVCDDPCIPFPRADWGCWEYTQSADPEGDKKCKNGKKGTVTYNTKRKFNTVTRAILDKAASDKCANEEPPGNADVIAADPKQQVKRSLPDIRELGNETQTAKGGVEPKTPLPEKLFKMFARKSKSQPTLNLLRKLSELETKRNVGDRNSLDPTRIRIMDIKSVLNRIFSRAHLHHQSFLNTNNVKGLCTSAVRQTENIKRPVSTTNVQFLAKGKRFKTEKDKYEVTQNKCSKGTCPKMIPLKGCKQKSSKGCEKERTPVCCENKPSPPYPSFSEAMDEEVEPYSKQTQWTCNKKVYGFHPNLKKQHQPLDSVKNRKKFSTSTSVTDSQQLEFNRMQDSNTFRPKTGNIVTRHMSIINSVSPRDNTKGRNRPNVNTAYVALNPERSHPVLKAHRHVSKASCRGILERDLLNRRPKTSGELNYSTIFAENRKTKAEFKICGDYTPLEKKRLLCHKGGNAPKLCRNTASRGYSTLQPNNSSVLYPLTTEVISQNIVLMNNLSSATANTSKTSVKQEFINQFQRSESNFKNKNSNSGKKKSCKKSKCAKFQLKNCPPKQREICKTHHPVICKKNKAPYPSFTDCMDDEMEEKITECPLVKERILRIQPKHMNELPKLPILEPIRPYQGRLDRKIEEDCIRHKLGLKNEGLTQCGPQFGEFIKPMRSKDYIKTVDKDCKRIEELKKIGKWPPKNSKSRGFCTKTTSFDTPKRDFSTLPNTYNISTCILNANTNDVTKSELYKSDMFTVNPTRSRENSLKAKRVYVRNYDALFNPENKLAESTKKKSLDLLRNQCEGSNEMCRYVKLKNIQWRINNFQKWCRLNKLSNLPTPVKRFHSCSKIKYKRYTKSISHPKNSSTSSIKCASTSENSDVCIQRGISTTIILNGADSGNDMGGGKRKSNKFAIVSKGRTARKCPKFRLPNCPPRVRTSCERKRVDRPCTKVVSPNPAFSECYDEEITQVISECPLERERFQRLQPQYPLLPEIGTIGLPPQQGRIDYSLEDDYIRLKLGIKNEGLTQDCETFGEPVKILKCRNYADSQYMSRGKASQCLIKKDRNSQRCKVPKQPCPSKCDSLWQRIVNYFKARPNCPSPDEWKKRALREKAEKAARAAGLCLCEPQDLPKRICAEDLPKVITPNCPPLNDEDDDDSCDGDMDTIGRKCTSSSRHRCGKLSNPRRCFSMTPLVKCSNATMKDEEGCDTCAKRGAGAIKKNYKANSKDRREKRLNPRRCFSTIPMAGYSNNKCNPSALKISIPITNHEDKQNGSREMGACKKKCSKSEDFGARIKCKTSVFNKSHDTLSSLRYLSTTINSSNSNKTINPLNSCDAIKNKDVSGSGHEGSTSSNLLKSNKANICNSGNKCGTSSNPKTCLSAIPKRCYSSNVGWKNLEEINKTIEEEEKKKLDEKMANYPNEDVHFLNDVNCNDDSSYCNPDTLYEEIFNEAILNKNEENDITKYVEVDDNQSDKDSPINFAVHIVPPEHNLVEIIFNEPVDELSNYSQAKAFAAFQDYFNNIDAFSEVSYEDLEKAKTNNLLKELDKLLEDKEETNKGN